MKTADLYIRVSTDEQADKGYSQRSQEEVLRRYCDVKGITVRKAIFEDHSAKSFVRPEWAKFLIDLKKKRGQTDLVLFTKWDRFSRNAGDAYQMISILNGLGVEPQAIEQPLDISVPENKMMLAFYLAAPEVENDRRALNTFFGMRRARKEGRWMGPAVVGYQNRVRENGQKYIAPREPDAAIMRWVYQELATGRWFIDQIWKEARKKGLSCGRKNFWQVIRNPVYCGKIFVPQYKDEEATIVQGQHEGLISEALFYQVMDVLDGRKKTVKTKTVSPDRLPLRGFLICPKCGYMLTGSSSKGCRKYYTYYHCFSTCGVRYNADTVNDKFKEELEKHTLHPAVGDLYKKIVLEIYNKEVGGQTQELRQLKTQLTDHNTKITKARDLLLNGEIDSADYHLIKRDSERKITILEAKLLDLSRPADNLPTLINKAVGTLSRLSEIYKNSGPEGKRRLISSMYPENLTFDGTQHRTTRLNEAIRVFDTVKAVIEGKKEGQITKNYDLPVMVAGSRIELPTSGL
ncbi:MAG TPA: recombinase family protein [Sphingobacteriaceae bacterium]